jgi:hypothetical protein
MLVVTTASAAILDFQVTGKSKHLALFGEEARKQTSAAAQKGRIRGNQNRSPSPVIFTGDGDSKRGPEYAEIVARKAQDWILQQLL